MGTTNTHPDDPQPHEAAPSEPHVPEQDTAQRTRAQSALAWATVGLSAAFCTTGAFLSLTGHQATGLALISAGSLGGGISNRK